MSALLDVAEALDQIPEWRGRVEAVAPLEGGITNRNYRVLVDGARLGAHVPRVLASHGIAMVPEGRGIFPGLTVKENFALGMWSAGVPQAEFTERDGGPVLMRLAPIAVQ